MKDSSTVDKSCIQYGSMNDSSTSDCNEEGRSEESMSRPSSSYRNYKSVSVFLFAIFSISFFHLKRGGIESLPMTDLQEEVLNPEHSEPSSSSINPSEQWTLIRDDSAAPPPFSTMHPVLDVHFLPFNERPKYCSPGDVYDTLKGGQKQTGHALPTNKWYQNMVLLPDGQDPIDEQRVYTVPYLVNTIGPIPGIKIHVTRVLAMERIVQTAFVDTHGITIGAAMPIDSSITNSMQDLDRGGVQRRYSVDIKIGEHAEGGTGKVQGPLTPLGLTLKWENDGNKQHGFEKMTSSIVRGMVYGTMHYHFGYESKERGFHGSEILPTVVSQVDISSKPLTDKGEVIHCSKGDTIGNETLVDKSVELHFWESDYTWLVFYSHPVYVRCFQLFEEESPTFILQATRLPNSTLTLPGDNVFTSRVALMNNCTTGTNPSHCLQGEARDQSNWSSLLKENAHIYPGKHTKIDYTFFSEEEDGGEHAYLQFDWDARRVDNLSQVKDNEKGGLLMYSLPHHREMLHPQASSDNSFVFEQERHCTPSLNGLSCVVKGGHWALKEVLTTPSFFAARPPLPTALPNIANALRSDISFRLPDYFQRGAGDTYFSGKMLAKLARILLIYTEIQTLCMNSSSLGDEYIQACNKVELPSSEEFNTALDHLRNSTQVWIDGNAETPFVFDGSFGGVVSCGCLFNSDKNACDNQYPDCPAFSDPGLDFGNAWYNDKHFHAGYHIYAAATISYFDSDWGKKYMENVMVLIRDIANPSPSDVYFPTYRMKDWYLGNSWASGIARAFLNGRNQESSSESIAAYESVALYGQVLAEIFKDGDSAKEQIARHMRDVGRLLMSTELRSADRYWHVRQLGPKRGIYPPQYSPFVVGIMWNMMGQFQTWFGAAEHLAYGIQLLPLTPISEQRDSLDWTYQMYPAFAKACATENCDDQGWGILEKAILASVGHPQEAIEYVEGLPADVFTSAGGNGHSKTNSIWYYSTRPPVDPLKLPTIPVPAPIPASAKNKPNESSVLDCDCPHTCTDEVLGYPAGGYTCGERISWLMKNAGKSERDACAKVAGVEFTDICAGCDPNRCIPPQVSPKDISDVCPSCTLKECHSSMNRCPALNAPFLCTGGANKGGCSMVPWKLKTEGGSNCESCCQLTFNCA